MYLRHCQFSLSWHGDVFWNFWLHIHCLTLCSNIRHWNKSGTCSIRTDYIHFSDLPQRASLASFTESAIYLDRLYVRPHYISVSMALCSGVNEGFAWCYQSTSNTIKLMPITALEAPSLVLTAFLAPALSQGLLPSCFSQCRYNWQQCHCLLKKSGICMSTWRRLPQWSSDPSRNILMVHTPGD